MLVHVIIGDLPFELIETVIRSSTNAVYTTEKKDGLCNFNGVLEVPDGWRVGLGYNHRMVSLSLLEASEIIIDRCMSSEMDNVTLWKYGSDIIPQVTMSQPVLVNPFHHLVDYYNAGSP